MNNSPTTAAQALSGDSSVYQRTIGYIMQGIVRFEYNGTTLDLVVRSLENGAKVGDTLLTPSIGSSVNSWKLIASGGGDRTPAGVWAEKIR